MLLSMKKTPHRAERGSTIVEALFCIILIMFIAMSLLQVFQWCVAKMLSDYSAYYAAKGEALGYAPSIVERAARVAIMGASGRDESSNPAGLVVSRNSLAARARDYMSYGEYGIYGVNYEYWEQQSGDDAYLNVTHSTTDEYARGQVQLRQLPMLAPILEAFIGSGENDIPAGDCSIYSYSSYFLNE